MARRQAIVTSTIRPDGTYVTVAVQDGVMPEDLVIHGVREEAARIVLGSDEWTRTRAEIKDYLIRLDIAQE